MKNILTIAGYDPSGGAGIQADLKTFSAFETYGISITTALTIQNTQGVFDTIEEINPKIISKQLQNLAEDIEIHAVKIGMVYSEGMIFEIASFLKQINCPIVILDPVLLSKNGFWLIQKNALPTLIEELFPLATMLTPNIKEVQFLSGLEIKDESDIKKSAEKIKNFGSKYVLIKGAYQRADSIIDLLYDGTDYALFPCENVKAHPFLHGTGCTFASAITATMAKGFPVDEAIKSAQNYLFMISAAPQVIGKGNYHLNHLGILQRNADKYTIICELKKAFEKLKNASVGDLIPEVQSNLVFAMEGATTKQEVAGFPGRIVRLGKSIGSVAAPEFGETKHMALTILAIIQFFPYLRSVMNIKYSEGIISACEKLEYSICKFDRKDEPEEIKNQEGKTLDWGVKSCISKLHNPPDIIYDLGDFGKEPIIRVIGRNPNEVVEKILAIVKNI